MADTANAVKSTLLKSDKSKKTYTPLARIFRSSSQGSDPNICGFLKELDQKDVWCSLHDVTEEDLHQQATALNDGDMWLVEYGGKDHPGAQQGLRSSTGFQTYRLMRFFYDLCLKVQFGCANLSYAFCFGFC